MMDIISSIVDPLLNPLISMDPTPTNPILTVFIIASIVGLLTTVANKLLVDQDRLQEVNQNMKSLQDELKKAKDSGDMKAMERVQKKQMDAMSDQTELMKMQFKPMFITMVPILIIFYGLNANPVINHMFVNLPQSVYYLLCVPIFQIIWHPAPGTPVTSIGWFGWYVLVTFAMSFLFRKALGMKSM
ncbi:MAG: EMC3/TMCO1 family protein [Methanobacteriaceae archaeon]|nr:EMC3/TMCO1 family protein [Methanobacteriaceae archaeon]